MKKFYCLFKDEKEIYKSESEMEIVSMKSLSSKNVNGLSIKILLINGNKKQYVKYS